MIWMGDILPDNTTLKVLSLADTLSVDAPNMRPLPRVFVLGP